VPTLADLVSDEFKELVAKELQDARVRAYEIVNENAGWHGTISGYTYHKCRCLACSKTMSAYNRSYYQARKNRVAHAN
jgi:hypothetical protein